MHGSSTHVGRPLIGVTRCGRLDDYLAAVRAAGGEPRVLEHGTDPAEAVGGIDGLLLTGGVDVDPHLYGETPHPTTQVDPARDAFEIPLTKAAVARPVPVLAICRGMQVLNVALAGTLVQDIPDQIGRMLSHSIEQPKDSIAHDVLVAPGSTLAASLRLTNVMRLPVNSRHHQAVANVATGLLAVATAPDGVVEAIEQPGARFCVGVQWHPENFWRTGEFGSLFEAFVTACRER
jgi:putative glutamine amidotransferase